MEPFLAASPALGFGLVVTRAIMGPDFARESTSKAFPTRAIETGRQAAEPA